VGAEDGTLRTVAEGRALVAAGAQELADTLRAQARGLGGGGLGEG
jgi:hypothetical protein